MFGHYISSVRQIKIESYNKSEIILISYLEIQVGNIVSVEVLDSYK